MQKGKRSMSFNEKKRLRLLVANDDGIEALGLHRLVGALSKKADVYVVAPDGQRSASGHSITIGGTITIEPMKVEGLPDAKMVLSVTGTPADCVKLGLKYLEEQGVCIDVVYSGINHGSNLGTDTLYSGTVAAAIEGGLCGVPSVAVSVDSHQATNFDMACRLAQEVLPFVLQNGERPEILNINTPNRPEGEIKGVRYTRLGVREYAEWFTAVDSCEGTRSYCYKGEPVTYKSRNIDIDVIANQEGYASITPLQCNMTRHEDIEILKNWGSRALAIGDE